ncbi:DsbA family protein [Candidatus Saccharibacteria bacterium]|nr:DsbA family protein [Candidatus Saccharibacteria bacterium]
MDKTKWIIFTIVAAGLFGALIIMSNSDKVDVSNIDHTKIQPATELSGNIADHTYGSNKNKVILIEYGDYQCPGCGSAYKPVKEVVEKYKDNLTFVFRNYPLTSLHPNAKAAAATAEAAGEMGKYWEMHNLLYEDQSSWNNASINERGEVFSNFASQIGLDKGEFTKKLKQNQDRYNKKITFDFALGKKAGVTGTPTFYLNGKIVDQKVKDGKIVTPNPSDDSQTQIWMNSKDFGKLLIEPALKEAGLLTKQ